MSSCELCGKETPSLRNVNIAGSVMRVCGSCASMGKTIDETSKQKHVFKKKKKQEKNYHVVSDYSDKISKAMNKRGLDVHQLARAVGIKESALSKFLSKKLQLDLDNARKLASFLEINLVQEDDEEGSVEEYLADQGDQDQSYTLEDLMKKGDK